MQTPEPEKRCRIDTCVSLSGFVTQRAKGQLEDIQQIMTWNLGLTLDQS